MTPEEAAAKQERYAKYRRARGITTSFYQALYGIQNIATYSKPNLWSEDNIHKCGEILGRCKVILENLEHLEPKIRDLTDGIPVEHDIILTVTNENPTTNTN